jgi:hypothetical protein
VDVHENPPSNPERTPNGGGAGSGEALNEHILGAVWPRADVRLEVLEEAVAVMRLLWEQASSIVTEEMVAGSIPAGPDPQPYIEFLREYGDVGYDIVHLPNIGDVHAQPPGHLREPRHVEVGQQDGWEVVGPGSLEAVAEGATARGVVASGCAVDLEHVC